MVRYLHDEIQFVEGHQIPIFQVPLVVRKQIPGSSTVEENSRGTGHDPSWNTL